MAFVYTDKGYVSSASIERITHKKDGYSLYNDEGGLMGTSTSVLDETVSVIPVSGQWEVLYALDGDVEAEPMTYLTEPVIAWALTLEGVVRPVVPSDLGRLSSTETDVLRQVGHEAVYDNAGGRQWVNAEEWLKGLRFEEAYRQKQIAARKAAES